MDEAEGAVVGIGVDDDACVTDAFLVVAAAEEDQVLGLGLGADDYIPKPVHLDVLFARLAVIMKWTRRTGTAAATTPPQPDIFEIGGARIDARRYTVLPPGGPEQTLSIRELGLLKTFAAHPGEVLTRDALLDALWGVHYAGTTRTLDQHIAQLRRKLGPAAAHLQTVHRLGYRYLPPS